MHPLFVKLFLTTDSDEDQQDEEQARQRSGKRQKRVMRNA